MPGFCYYCSMLFVLAFTFCLQLKSGKIIVNHFKNRFPVIVYLCKMLY